MDVGNHMGESLLGQSTIYQRTTANPRRMEGRGGELLLNLEVVLDPQE